MLEKGLFLARSNPPYCCLGPFAMPFLAYIIAGIAVNISMEGFIMQIPYNMPGCSGI